MLRLCDKDAVYVTTKWPTLTTACSPQVKALSNESLRLSASYPGANAQVISSNVEEVHQAWESLQAVASARKKKLRAASELQKFLSSVRGVHV